MILRRFVVLRTASSSIFFFSSSSSSSSAASASRVKVSPHEVLGLPPHATFEEVKTRYNELTRRYHPDMPGGDSEKFCEIIAAYRLLRASDRKRRSENIDDGGLYANRHRKAKESRCNKNTQEQENQDLHGAFKQNKGLVWELLWLYEGYELLVIIGAALLVVLFAVDRYLLVRRMTQEKRARIRAMEEGLPPSMPLVIDEEMLQRYGEGVSQEEIDIDNAMAKEDAYYRRATQRRFEDFREFLFVYDPDGVTSRKVTTTRFSIQYLDEALIPKRCVYVCEFNSEKKDQRYEKIVNEVSEKLKNTPWMSPDAQHIAPLVAKGIALIPMNSPDTSKWTFVEYKDNDRNEPPSCLMAIKNNRFERLGMCQRVVVTGNKKLSPALAKKREEDIQNGALTAKELVTGKRLPIKDLSIPLEQMKL